MTRELAPVDPQETEGGLLATRRRLVAAAGVTLVGVTLTGCVSAQSTGPAPPMFPHVELAVRPEFVAGASVIALKDGTKPVYIARPGSRDPLEHSVADTLFWGDIMMEHAMFFVMLMPGEELAGPRNEARRFQTLFADHLARLRNSRLDGRDYRMVNQETIALVQPFARYKRRTQLEQEAGRIHTLVWSTFFDHTRREAERFIRRLEQLNGGSSEYDKSELVPFWTQIMEEHALFIAHLLDPQEQALIAAAEGASTTFRKLRIRSTQGRGRRDLLAAVDSIIDFKTAAEEGIETGQIKSIIHPALADHVRREAVRFRDELLRAT